MILAVVGLQFEARIAAGPLIRTLRLPPGSKASDIAIAGADRGVVSFGICGGLAPSLRPGACIVASGVHDGERLWPTDEGWSDRLMRAIAGATSASILGVEAPVADVARKRRLFERFGTSAVDTESHLAAAAARAHGLPFAAIRAVADDAGRGLPAAALAGLRPDGTIDVAAVLRSLLASPATQLPALIQVAVHTRAARAALSRARPLLGEDFALSASPARRPAA